MEQKPEQPTPGGRRLHKDDTPGRERLLDTAILLFSDRGIANTTIAQIAKEGKVTSAMVHYWFETREKLYDAVVEERLGPLIQAIWEPADIEHESAIELIRGLLTRMFEVTDVAPWVPSLWLREIVQVGGLLRERLLRRIPRDRSNAFRQKIVEAQSRGEVNPEIEPTLLFTSMLAQVMLPQATTSCVWHEDNTTMSLGREQIRRHAVALLMRGLAGPAIRPEELNGGRK
ncbi:TetR/AcrR family transcriptional regulator [Paralcaligenes ureilyticus]|uniref:TetR family transcriptional regulator n=1 Tax=Paralcaligenes ureilyticus TaxID=627131 RepID=A0A4R3M775_9BURK|nr:TetR/AcrR family transcriptional regulator [Paralcaligenes ureilyticus]TCT08932.1 TetR family transcriptional regulator [Paralcaligenes ureilyticus]